MQYWFDPVGSQLGGQVKGATRFFNEVLLNPSQSPGSELRALRTLSHLTLTTT